MDNSKVNSDIIAKIIKIKINCVLDYLMCTMSTFLSNSNLENKNLNALLGYQYL